MRLVGKAVRASDEEVAANVRARSAIMRVAEKIS
jgi:16S rRNA (cytosine1402-N4)-methyltransferase